MTARKDAEADRESLLDSEWTARGEAERTSRAKYEFLATLSHELRTLLNAILGWSQVLAGGTRDEEELAEGLVSIQRNARAQTRIIEDLLDMSRIINGKVRLDVLPVDLGTVIREAVVTAKPSANANPSGFKRCSIRVLQVMCGGHVLAEKKLLVKVGGGR